MASFKCTLKAHSLFEPLTTGTLWCRGNELEAWQTQGRRQGAVGPKALMQDGDSWERARARAPGKPRIGQPAASS